MDWIALDSAAALAILCHTLEELWDAEWRASLSESESIIAYAYSHRKEMMVKIRGSIMLSGVEM